MLEERVGSFQGQLPTSHFVAQAPGKLIMAFRFLLACGLAHKALGDDEAPACHLLQTGIHLQRKTDQRTVPFYDPNVRANITRGICVSNLSTEELAEPLFDVSARYQEDGFCVYGYAGLWASGCAVTRKQQSAIPYATQFNPYYAAVINVSSATPFTLQLYDGRTVAIRNHNYPLATGTFLSLQHVF